MVYLDNKILPNSYLVKENEKLEKKYKNFENDLLFQKI